MRERFQLPLAMCRVQYHLLGGHWRMLLIAVIYLGVAVIGSVSFRRILRNEPLAAIVGWLVTGLTGIQVLAAVFGGCSAVHRAMLRDYETKMIESHRLTPMSNVSVALGYLFGSTLQVLLLMLLNVAIGCVLVALEGRPVSHWLWGNLVLWIGAVSLWAATVFMGLRSGKPLSPAPALIGIAMVTVPAMFLPGAGLFLGTYAVVFAVWVLTGSITVATPALFFVVLISFILGIFWVSCAAARYRRPDLPALNAVRGLLLLVFWLVVATAGIIAYEHIAPRFAVQFYAENHLLHQWVATMILSLVFGAVAVSGAVECELLVVRGAAPRRWTDRVSSEATCLIAALLIWAVLMGVGWPVWVPDIWKPWGTLPPLALTSPWVVTFGACVLAMLTIRGVMAVVYPKLTAGKLMVGLFVIIAWGGPPGADSLRAVYLSDFGEDPVPSFLTGCSPAGSIAGAWYDASFPRLPGLLVQAVLAVLTTFLAWRMNRRSATGTAEPASTRQWPSGAQNGGG